MSVIIGIDVGGSTTKIVGFRVDGEKRELIAPQFVRANDPITATYGAFGKFTDENRISIKEKHSHSLRLITVSIISTISVSVGESITL